VAVDARQHAMHADELAAYAIVLEVRTRPRALRMALAAVGPEHVVVDVVVAMAGDAQVAGAAEEPPARVTRHARHAIVRAGVVQVPEGREILAQMTVEENLLMGLRGRDRSELASAYDRFPILRERRALLAGSLSGGEQQMLAIARALLAQPRLLLLDEPSLGLAPLIVKRVFETLADLKRHGVTMLLVEQSVNETLTYYAFPDIHWQKMPKY